LDRYNLRIVLSIFTTTCYAVLRIYRFDKSFPVTSSALYNDIVVSCRSLAQLQLQPQLQLLLLLQFPSPQLRMMPWMIASLTSSWEVMLVPLQLSGNMIRYLLALVVGHMALSKLCDFA